MTSKAVLSAQDHARIAEAINNAEKSTSGEIYCVVARKSDDYFFPAAFFCSLAIIIAMVPAAYVTASRWDPPHHMVLPVAGVAALVSALLLLRFAPALRINFVPRYLRFRRASANAVSQFLSHNIHVTENRTGVLIFVSLAERYGEIVADSGINKKVEQNIWDSIIGDLTASAAENRLAEGYVQAIKAVGQVLTQHFPANPGDRNELTDHLVEI
ncbi:MAG: TPM domain-containing protein [Rhizobiaceae bacterium]